MPIDSGRKLALFLSFVLIVAGLLTLVPMAWLIGTPSCHSCHDAQMPVSHLLYQQNFLGYMSICPFSPFSTLVLIGLGVILFATQFRFRFERWGKDYRMIGAGLCIVLAALTALPIDVGYTNLIGGTTFDPLFPASTIVLLALAVIAYSGFVLCPFLMFWRARCPALGHDLDVWQSPHRSLNRLVKLTVTGKLNDGDVKSLYDCTLCNGCLMAPVQRLTRDMAVRRGIVPSHLSTIRQAVATTGNAYGAAADGGTLAGDSTCDTILFAGCTARFRTPEILEAAKQLLDARGIRYRTMADESCCGYTLYNLGDLEAAGRAMDANVAKLKAAGARRIITICPGCYDAFSKLYRGRDGFQAEVALAMDLLKDAHLEDEGLVVHDPCHAKGRHDLARSIVRGAGDESAGGCCGAGGGLISWDRLIAEARAKQIIRDSGRKIVTYCPFCYLNFKRADPASVVDLYVLLASQARK